MTALTTASPLSGVAAERFDHPHPGELQPLTATESARYSALSAIEGVQYGHPRAILGEVVGVVLLRRRRFEGDPQDHLVAQELPTFGVVAEFDGHVGWLAKGLPLLDPEHLELFQRKALELLRSVTREGVIREAANDPTPLTAERLDALSRKMVELLRLVVPLLAAGGVEAFSRKVLDLLRLVVREAIVREERDKVVR